LSYANQHRPAALYQELFIPLWRASASSRGWARASANSASATSCCRWTQPSCLYASRCSPGPNAAATKAE
jgi:hypothetical protein